MAIWRDKNKEIILFLDLDANENAYDGHFERHLKEADIQMVEQFEKTTGAHAPNLQNGSKAICGCFTSPCIIYSNTFVAAHDAGVGDHHYHDYDFSAETVLGQTYMTISPSVGRNLNCWVARTRENYNKVVLHFVQWHTMFLKGDYLTNNQDSLPGSEFPAPLQQVG